ncbi:MAG TPA: geranylgeranyl reductase family protein [Candidatus Xenobia bacterium]
MPFYPILVPGSASPGDEKFSPQSRWKESRSQPTNTRPVKPYDVVVVGGGPAGAAAALVLARGGARVALLDRQRFPRDKVCGDALGPGTVEVLTRLGLMPGFLACQPYRIDGIRFVGPDGGEVTPKNPARPGYVLQRLTLDDFLFRTAGQAGAEVFEATKVTALERAGDRIVGVRAGDTTWPCRFVIGADGEHSVVRQQVGVDTNSATTRAFALRYYVSNLNSMLDNVMEILCDHELLPGYAWVFPLPNGGANVGCGMLAQDLHRSERSLTRYFQDWLDAPVQKARWAHAVSSGRPRGWPLSLGSRLQKRAGPGWMLCGDAASLVDPLTGEGIHAAIHSGELAAQAILAHPDDAAGQYESACQKVYGRHLRAASLLQSKGRSAASVNRMVRSAGRHADLAMDMLGVFGGVLPATVLLRPLGLWRYLW